MQTQWIVKKSTQPLGHQSARLHFSRTPAGLVPSMLIEQCGLKGTRIGGAAVSDRHANYIVADPGTKARDVLQLMEQVRGTVAERLGVELENELQIW